MTHWFVAVTFALAWQSPDGHEHRMTVRGHSVPAEWYGRACARGRAEYEAELRQLKGKIISFNCTEELRFRP